MASYENIYSGASSSFEPTSGNPSQYRVNTANIAFPSDPMTANQLQAVSKKISTGAKTIEVSGLGLAARSAMAHLAAIPKQHWQEIDRLRKLTGVDLTFHGPLIEATGVIRDTWSEDQRREVEKQGFEAVKLAQQMNPQGNVVVTFHSSNGLPTVEQRIKVGENPDGTPKEKIIQMAVVDERTGRIGPIPQTQREYLEKEGKEIGTAPEQKEWLEDYNKRLWSEPLQSLAIETNRARGVLDEVAPLIREIDKKAPGMKGALQLHDLSLKNPKEYQQIIQQYKKVDPDLEVWVENINQNVNFAKAVSQNSYLGFKESFNRAMETAKDEDKQKLEEFKKEALPVFKDYLDKSGKYNINDFNKELIKGLNVLNSLKNEPQTFKPLKEWAVEKAGTTFGNIAWNSYEKFKEHSPIISIENPPVGLTGLTRADEIVDLINKSRKVFEENAVKKGMSQKEAEEKAKKIIGATWDTGHINSMRKWGYDEADVLGEAKKISPYVKHMHIADNLGFEDAELPAGMGNAPIGDIINLFPKNIKRVIETGDWFSRQGGMAMSYTPTREAFEGLGAPIYSMGEVPWGASTHAYGGYFGGVGPINPPIHHSTYGSGFSGLPVELGGEIPGAGGQSRFSGTPME